MSSIILQQLLNGLLDGIYYLLIALGLSLIFSLGGIVNLAHGAFYAIGAYLTTLIAPQLGYGGALILSPITVAILGIFLERYFFRRFYRSDPILSLLLTFGLAMVCEQSLRMIFGAAPLSFGIPDGLRGQIFLGDFIYSKFRAILLAIACLCVAGLWFLFLPHVHDLHFWQLRSVDPPRKADPEIPFAVRIVGTLKGGGCASQNHRGLFQPTPHHRQIPGMVPGRLSLLVTPIMLLIHHDQP
ncbi:MAG: branched-chain amino acid ABC transporter permease, partial [Betaproteobacteria bacterium]|nr:branched-chain amino acid ABC transporter permease [Betaproteobacteria bacterium]